MVHSIRSAPQAILIAREGAEVDKRESLKVRDLLGTPVMDPFNRSIERHRKIVAHCNLYIQSYV